MFFIDPKRSLAPYSAFVAIFAILFTTLAPAASAQKIKRSPGTEFQTPGIIDYGKPAADTVVPETTCGGTISFGTDGGSTSNTFGNVRTYSQNGVGVKASAHAKVKSTGAWETAFLGSYGSYGFGVTDRGEPSGAPHHRVDNNGNRWNYVALHFDRLVDVNSVRLESVSDDNGSTNTDDSDITYWVGNTSTPYGSTLAINDAVLGSFGPAIDNNAGDSNARTATINPTDTIGNVLVIAASISDTTPDDWFKLANVNVSCPSSPSATVTIIKEVDLTGPVDKSTQAFGFTASGPGMQNFSLTDNDIVGPDRNTTVVTAFGAANAIVVKENQTFGWSLNDIRCTTAGGAAASVAGNLTDGVTITSVAGSSTTCTFVNGQNLPSAAKTTISGRALLANGKGVRDATLTLNNLQTGETRTVRTNSFGYYMFDEVEVDSFYVVTISHRRYSFGESSRGFTLMDQIADMNFYEAF